MKKNIISLLLLTIPLVCHSQATDEFRVTHGPYLQNSGQTGVTVVWTTSKAAIPGINLTDAEGNTYFIRNSEDGIINGGGTLHKVRIEGLEPGKSYNYRLNSVEVLKYQPYQIYYGDTIMGKEYILTTYPVNPEKVHYTVINDVHELSGKMASYLKKLADQDFYIFNGDMVGFLQENDQLWPGFIDTAVHYFASVKPFYYVRGNHEMRGVKARELRDFFDYKDNRFYYSFDYGPVHFIVLDCGEDKPDDSRYYYGLADYDAYRMKELDWLKAEIKSQSFLKAKKRIVICHFPVVREKEQGHGMQFMADNFGPVLRDAGIDLMISGHLHVNSFYSAEKSGFNYPVLVNSNNSFVEVEADAVKIRAVVRDISGSLVQTYVID